MICLAPSIILGMKRVLLLFVFLIAACSDQTIKQTPLPPGTLVPYATYTPSSTAEQSEELVASIETPLPTPTPFTYAVQAGDTLSGIAQRFGISLDVLVAANPDVSPNSMSIGTELKIPGSSADPASASTPTPVPVSVTQIECYPTSDKGMWCFVLIHNDTQNVIENLSAQVTLLNTDNQPLTSALATSPLNILPVGASLPLMVFFPPLVPADVHPQAQILTGISLDSEDRRYLPATVNNTLAQMDNSGRNAQVSGTVRLPEDAQPASLVWVAAVVYDEFGHVVGVRRWESTVGIVPGGSLQYAFEASSLAGVIEKVDFLVEARP